MLSGHHAEIQSKSKNYVHCGRISIGMAGECGNLEELRTVDSNLASLCQHLQTDGWNAGAFSDVVVDCMGATFHLHKLVLSRSSYFRHMLQGPWKEASASAVTLQIDDENVDREAVSVALSYLYGHYPKLSDSNAFRVLAAASFLDLQDLCAICTDYIISEIWSSNFLVYQAFAERQDYGIHGDRIWKACWGYLCRGGAMELHEILPKLSTQTLCALLTSDELWVPNEEKRFELALNTFLAKVCLLEENHSCCPGMQSSETWVNDDLTSEKDASRQTEIFNEKQGSRGVSKCACLNKKLENLEIASEILFELADSVVDGYCQARFEVNSPHANNVARYCHRTGTATHTTEKIHFARKQTEVKLCHLSNTLSNAGREEGRSKDSNNSFQESASSDCQKTCFDNQIPIPKSATSVYSNSWGRNGSQAPSWGGRIVQRKQSKTYPRVNNCISNQELEALLNIFESGGIFYCHMTFEVLLDVRKRLEELGFSCKSVYDGLWLQMLLRNQILSVSSEACKICCLLRQSCRCRQNYDVFSHGRASDNYYRDDQQRINGAGSVGSFYTAESSGSGSPVPPRVRVRTSIDGLAGIGRGSTFTSEDGTWLPTRVIFSRVPYGLGGRNSQSTLANEQSDGRLDIGEMEFVRDGLTVAVGLSQGYGNNLPVNSDRTSKFEEHAHSRVVKDATGPLGSGRIVIDGMDANNHPIGQEGESSHDSPIALDLQTPLRVFPPFRFGVQFEDVHQLGDGQAKHSSEVFYAGSLWKISVQAFNDEDPQGRRTLGLFLHRRKAEKGDTQHKVHLYVDNREKVTVRYQLICPTKRDVLVLGNRDQPGTLLPKAPKGWGWRTALLFDDLPDLLQGGFLRVAAVIQII